MARADHEQMNEHAVMRGKKKNIPQVRERLSHATWST